MALVTDPSHRHGHDPYIIYEEDGPSPEQVAALNRLAPISVRHADERWPDIPGQVVPLTPVEQAWIEVGRKLTALRLEVDSTVVDDLAAAVAKLDACWQLQLDANHHSGDRPK